MGVALMPQSPQQKADSKAQLDHFADLLSCGMDIPDIRQRMGLTNGRAQQLMMKIRADLGRQAQ